MNPEQESRIHNPAGGFTAIDGEVYYRITGYDAMPPFLMSIASDTDLWMFISSAGGLTAGRVDADGSLFPYETSDKLHDAHHHTGPLTLIRANTDAKTAPVWRPFHDCETTVFDIERNLYKNVAGTALLFEEINNDLGLSFRYRWSGCDELGWVRSATLMNRGSSPVNLSIMDGLRNILPFGAPLALYQQLSCLVDAYKRCDRDPETGLGIFSLTARIIDRPEAAEVLRANVAWCQGLTGGTICLSRDAIPAFLRGDTPSGDTVLTGRRGNYLVYTSSTVGAGESLRWHIAADAGRSHAQIARLRGRLRDRDALESGIERLLRNARDNLLRTIGSADGLQLTARTETHVHHAANVLFNTMRGGVFSDNYDLPAADFLEFLETRNRKVAQRHRAMVDSLPPQLPLRDLLAAADRTGDADLRRLSREYLPIFFGRRHGDPSRPWNRFSIELKKPDGSRALRYEGNWRDIFQNWEALGLSFPGALQNMIAKFVNASTVDGFNPYRITRDGIDWEISDPDDPWSFIGYWGDHQIIYLLKFLEALERFRPGTLETMLEEEIFSYADVPYRIEPYEQILEDPHSTIRYDSEHAARIDERVAKTGTDGKLYAPDGGPVYHVNLMEKLLVPALSKLSNLVPGGGIWMNTQRPEWNDANNALVGYGISMVTLCYLRRYLLFLEQVARRAVNGSGFAVSTEVCEWFGRISSILTEHLPLLENSAMSGTDRKMLLDAVGSAFSRYRQTVYANGFSGKEMLSAEQIGDLCKTAGRYLDHAISRNRREDGLYDAYNLLDLSGDAREAAVNRLYEMLEGQVAVLSSGKLGAAESAELLAALFESSLYRPDQRSFLLYPARTLPAFLQKNILPAGRVLAIPLLKTLLERKNRSILERDPEGAYHFNPDFSNRNDLSRALDRLAEHGSLRAPVSEDRGAILALFEETFNHTTFTGRSGTMYGYEGLGSIYWHMVAKLLLAAQEAALQAARAEDSNGEFKRLAELYYRIRDGLGFNKSPAEYGAFPTDPYSHTPAHAGARQPGMTGQVKEEIITRFGELGLVVEEGCLSFQPVLLKRGEFLAEPSPFRFYDVHGTARTIELPPDALGFTFCQVPVVYELCADAPWIQITPDDGSPVRVAGTRLDADLSRAIFDRLGRIARIDVGVREQLLLAG